MCLQGTDKWLSPFSGIFPELKPPTDWQNHPFFGMQPRSRCWASFDTLAARGVARRASRS